MKNKYLKIFELLISIAVSLGFIYIFYKIIGFKTFLKFLKEVSVINVLIAFFIYTLSYITRTYRWKITLSIKEFKKLFKLTVYNTVFNIFLPFRTGELSFFYMLKKENVPIKDSALSFFTVRIFDALSLGTVFLVSLFLYKGLILYAGLFFLISPLIFYILKYLTGFIKNDKFQKFHSEVLSLKNLLILYFLSILTYILKFTSFYFVLPKNINLSFIENFFASASGDLTTILPIHGLAGIGTYEAGYIGILVFLGVDKETAILSSVFVHIFILTSSALLSLLCYLLLRK